MELDPPTTESLGQALGVHQATASRYLRGIPPGINRAPAIAKLLDVPLEEALRLILEAHDPPDTQRRLDALEERVRHLEERRQRDR